MSSQLPKMLLPLVTIAIFCQITTVSCDCATTEDSSKPYLSLLDPIKGKTFTYTFKDGYDKEHYLYEFSICTDLKSGVEHAGITQERLDEKGHRIKTIGRINSTSVKVGRDWMMLTYKAGDRYGSHCHQEARQAHIVITCRQGVDAANFAVLYEENSENSKSDCFYLMELESRVACTNQSTGLSTGAVLVIVFSCLIGAYLLFGMLYKRFITGAKGLEQVPNIGFWRSCGNMQADGCDFLCRCQESGFDSSRPYRGIADEQLDDEADDENLLPM